MKYTKKAKIFFSLPFVFLKIFVVAIIDVEYSLLLLNKWVNIKRKNE